MNKLYGVDYNIYVTGGIGNPKLALHRNETVIFYTESEMLREVAKLKENYSIGEIRPFVTDIKRVDYSL